MFVGLYSWKVKEGMEKKFVEDWKYLTDIIYRCHGSLGARLHKGHDGIYYAYAAWPSREASDEFWQNYLLNEEVKQKKLWQGCVEKIFPDLTMECISDLLHDEPYQTKNSKED